MIAVEMNVEPNQLNIENNLNIQFENAFNDVINEIRVCIQLFEQIYDEYANNYGQTCIKSIEKYYNQNRMLIPWTNWTEHHFTPLKI